MFRPTGIVAAVRYRRDRARNVSITVVEDSTEQRFVPRARARGTGVP